MTSLVRAGQKFLMMKRKNGILEVRLHTNGDSMQWGAPAHQGLHYFFDWAGRDPDNEVIILGGTGKDFTKGIGRLKGGKWEPATEFASDPEVACRTYEYQYYDGTNDIEGQIFDLEVPPIGVWNGAAFHTDLVLLTDITLCTEDAWTTDMHFRINMVPGDGIQIPWGGLIMRTGTRVTRRITTQIIRKPWKEDIANELLHSFSTGMYVTATEHSPHDVSYWQWAHKEAELVRKAEKKGKVIRPRVNGGQEEDEIK